MSQIYESYKSYSMSHMSLIFSWKLGINLYTKSMVIYRKEIKTVENFPVKRNCTKKTSSNWLFWKGKSTLFCEMNTTFVGIAVAVINSTKKLYSFRLGHTDQLSVGMCGHFCTT